MIEISSGSLSAVINPLGAELTSLRDAEGHELMTDADPAFWTGRSPLLFPIVGGLNRDCYRLDGQEYALPRHGFARRQRFEVVEQASDRAVFHLTDNDETRAAYPFAFLLDVEFLIHDAVLNVLARVRNQGVKAMPASFGFHPAFAWPLPYGEPKEAHRIEFSETEQPEIRRVTKDGLIASQPQPSPLQGRDLRLRDALFTDDALIWDAVRSEWVTYGVPGGRQLEIWSNDMPMLGIWTQPGAHFICIEPWDGMADIEGFAGEIWEKLGMRRIEPGGFEDYQMRIALYDEGDVAALTR